MRYPLCRPHQLLVGMVNSGIGANAVPFVNEIRTPLASGIFWADFIKLWENTTIFCECLLCHLPANKHTNSQSYVHYILLI